MSEPNRIYDQRAVEAVEHLDKIIRDIQDDELLCAGSDLFPRERIEFFDKIRQEIENVSSQISSLEVEYDQKCEDGELYGVLREEYSRYILIGCPYLSDGTAWWKVIDRDDPNQIMSWSISELQTRRITPDTLFRIYYNYGVSSSKE